MDGIADDMKNTKGHPEGTFPDRQHQKLKRSVTRHWAEYCRSTSLHGLQYVGEKRRPWFDRMFWICIFVVSAGIALSLIVKLWTKWEASPVLVSFDDKATSVKEIPFPAITLCSEVKIKRTVLNFTELVLHDGESRDMSDKLEFASILCDITRPGENATTTERFINFLEEVSPKHEDVFGELKCIWHEEYQYCQNIFGPTITDDGLCYTFNGLPPGELYQPDILQRTWWSYYDREVPNWSLEGGYRASAESYPWRTHYSGYRAGLKIPLILLNEQVDPLCRIPVDAYKMSVHSPADFPLMMDNFFRIPMSFDTLIGVRPLVAVTSQALRSYSPWRRGCYFDGERSLRYFHVYTEQNCNVECVTNYTLSHCGCVAYFMPRIKNTAICAEDMRDCIKAAREMFHSAAGIQVACSCLPACTEIKYDVESSSQAPLKLADTASILLKAHPGYDSSTSKTLNRSAYVTVYFNNRFFVKSKRTELYGLADFIANCGGLLGFYLGFSILSLVELLYFFSMRLIGNIAANKKAKLQSKEYTLNT